MILNVFILHPLYGNGSMNISGRRHFTRGVNRIDFATLKILLKEEKSKDEEVNIHRGWFNGNKHAPAKFSNREQTLRFYLETFIPGPSNRYLEGQTTAPGENDIVLYYIMIIHYY